MQQQENKPTDLKKMAKDWNKYSIKEDKQMADNHMKRYSISVAIRKM